MSDTPSRRAVLGTGAATILGSFAGCTLTGGEVSGGHLYVENTLPTEYQIELIVAEGMDQEGEQIIDNWFITPPDTALTFEEVLEPGTAYTITVHRPTVPPEDYVTLTVNACDENGDTSRDVSVRVRKDGMGIIPWGCDEDEYEKLDLEYVDASNYTIQPPEEARTEETES